MNCRSCNTPIASPFLDLGPNPLSNAYLTQDQLTLPEPKYPLAVYWCPNCYLVQIPEFETAKTIFSDDYPYYSSYSSSWLSHSKAYAENMISRFELSKDNFVVEIGSNDGYLLQYFNENGITTLGIDPAKNAAAEAAKKGVDTIVSYFDPDVAQQLASQKKPDLIAANNVIAHNPNLNEFVNGLAILLAPNGVITIECPHLLALINGTQFDTIYHVHFTYLSLMALLPLFKRHGLRIFDIDELETHGGSLRLYACHANCLAHRDTAAISQILKKEMDAGLDKETPYKVFSQRVLDIRNALVELLGSLAKEGKSVAGYGAPAKGNTLLNFCDISTKLLSYTVDRNPVKQNRFLPGTHIPILAPVNS